MRHFQVWNLFKINLICRHTIERFNCLQWLLGFVCCNLETEKSCHEQHHKQNRYANTYFTVRFGSHQAYIYIVRFSFNLSRFFYIWPIFNHQIFRHFCWLECFFNDPFPEFIEEDQLSSYVYRFVLVISLNIRIQ